MGRTIDQGGQSSSGSRGRQPPLGPVPRLWRSSATTVPWAPAVMVSGPRMPASPEKWPQKPRKKEYGAVTTQNLAEVFDFRLLEFELRSATADEARRLAIALRAAASSAELRSLEAENDPERPQ